MQEIDMQASGRHKAVVSVEQIEELKRLNDTLQESIVQFKDAKTGMDDAREICESIYKRLWGIIDGIQVALLRAREHSHQSPSRRKGGAAASAVFKKDHCRRRAAAQPPLGKA